MKLAEEVTKICDESPAYDNATHAVLTAKTRIHDYQIAIQDINKMISQADKPEKKISLQARLQKKQQELKDWQDHLQQSQAHMSKLSH